MPGIKNLKSWIESKKKFKIFHENFKKFQNLSEIKEERFSLRWKERYPCLKDDTGNTYFDRHYIYHTAWAARVLAKLKPQLHIDISSSLYFASLISAFIPFEYYDYRPPRLELNNIKVKNVDLTSLSFASKSINSLSCMHVVEHVGLGRYGDPIDPGGDLKAISELKRVMAPGGVLLFVVPVGYPKVIFNAHRIYSYSQVISYFPGFELVEFALVPDNQQLGDFIYNASEEISNKQKYGCGCFFFKRKE